MGGWRSWRNFPLGLHRGHPTETHVPLRCLLHGEGLVALGRAARPDSLSSSTCWTLEGYRGMRNAKAAPKGAAFLFEPTQSITVVKSSSTNSIPTFGLHQQKTHGYKSGLSGYAYPSGISR